MFVSFSLPPGWSDAIITRIAYYIHSESSLTLFTAYVVDGTWTQVLWNAENVLPTATDAWLIIDIPDTYVNGDFFVGMQNYIDYQPLFGVDVDSPDLTSVYGTPNSFTTIYTSGDFMFRAELANPVGGVVHSPNTLGLLSPLLIVTGLIGAIAIGSFAIKKRRI